MIRLVNKITKRKRFDQELPSGYIAQRNWQKHTWSCSCKQVSHQNKKKNKVSKINPALGEARQLFKINERLQCLICLQNQTLPFTTSNQEESPTQPCKAKQTKQVFQDIT